MCEQKLWSGSNVSLLLQLSIMLCLVLWNLGVEVKIGVESDYNLVMFHVMKNNSQRNQDSA